MVPTTSDEAQHTPSRSASKRTAAITQAQKQALLDNLQLETTERARKLRAQYALQAQGLRARLEMRVNRIPQALRKRKMQDLLDEHTEKEKPDSAVGRIAAPPPARSPEKKSLKRQSHQISRDGEEDKEKAAEPSTQDLANPNKRTKTGATANTKVTRTASRNPVPSTLLSPKSNNPRILPRSPFKPSGSPEKAMTARPINPVKPSTQHLAPPAAASRGGGQSRAASRQAKAKPGTAALAGTASDVEGRSSEASTTSAGTTIVHKAVGKTGAAAGTAAKRSAGPKTAAVGRKAASAAKKVDVMPAAATRTLRRRG